jgi:hypothetical protein
MRRTTAVLFLLAVTLSASARDAADHWFEVRSQHFVVLTDTNEKQARRVAIQFERMRSVFQVLMPAATNFAPKGDLNPCTDIEGLKAKVGYAEVSDKSIAGQILSVELSK